MAGAAMDQDTEIVYETLCHVSSAPFTSNYPPLPTMINNGGGFLSSLRHKWSHYKNPSSSSSPSTLNKQRVSLFISPRAERVAVATANQITILHKQNDYQLPSPIFTTGRDVTFTCGVWSEHHDVLGVVDDTDTLYFVRANGDEINRITRRELKLSSPIIGLLPQDDNGAQESCLCSFTLLTLDGSLHHIETSQAPSASISSTLSANPSSASKRKFPKNILCFDYCPESSLLAVVGTSDSLLSSSSGNSGPCCLSLWRRCQNLDLESLFSVQFDGLYSEQKNVIDQLARPKVLLSPQDKFVATLDIRGCLHIFMLDGESCSPYNLDGGERLSSQATDNESSEQNRLLNDVVDFTWWSDHIVTLVKRGGILTMLDVLTGSKLQETDPAYSLPVLDRVQQFQGHIFIVESKSSVKTKVSSNHNIESSGAHSAEPILLEDEYNQFDVSRLRWSLISISQRSVPEMYNILICNHKYEAAINFARRHDLDEDEVLKSQWLHSGQGIKDVNMLLSKIKDHRFILSECIDKVGSSEDAVKAVLACGLRLTDQFRFGDSKDSEGSQIWDFRMARLQLLQFRDRLETYMGINMGRFSVQEYRKFRVIPLNEAAVKLAEGGKIGALNLLFKRHPYSLSPFMLKILAAVPETVPVQTYDQLLPGRSPPTNIVLREEDWIECEEMASFINRLPEKQDNAQIRTESMIKRCLGYLWPSPSDLSIWYKNRAKDIDCYSGQLENCLCLVDSACRKGIHELQKFREDILCLHQLIYSDENGGETCLNMSLVAWEQLSDFEKFRMMLKEVKEESVVKKLNDNAIPFMHKRCHNTTPLNQDQDQDQDRDVDRVPLDCKDDSFLVRWLKEIALENKLDLCLIVMEEGCRELQINGFFKDETEALDCALQCIYLCTATDKWTTMSALLSKVPKNRDAEANMVGLEKRLKLADGHIEAGRLLAFYQVPKPLNFLLEAHADEKGLKQILRLILSKFVRRQPGRSDNDWANMWRDMQCLRDKAFPFLVPEYMLVEFCRGLLKAGKFSLARNYLKGTSSVTLALDKAENIVIQAAREYFFSASSLSGSEIWKAKECLNLFPNSRLVKAEADIIDALTVKLPNLGVTLLPMQFRQIKDPMEIIKLAISSQAGAYVQVDELIEVAKLVGLSSADDISVVQEAIAREAAVTGDLQLAFDLCLLLAKKGHGPIWDLCVAIARGPALENMDINSRKNLLGFALSYCDEESIGELLHAWKDLDMQSQCETLLMLTGTGGTELSRQSTFITPLPEHDIRGIDDFKDFSELAEGIRGEGQGVLFSKINSMFSLVAKTIPLDSGADLESLLQDNVKILSFASCQLPWLLELSTKAETGKKFNSDFLPRKCYVSIQTQATLTILSWLARNGFAPKDNVISSLAKTIIEPPVTEEEDLMGCSFLLNLFDAFSGVEVIEEQLRIRENYQEICSIMNVGMAYSLLHNSAVECKSPAQRRELLLGNFKEKHTPISSDEISKIDEVQSTFWREWKLKLEEKKRVAEYSRELDYIIPGVDTDRFLSGDFDYIEGTTFSLIESVKFEKKHTLRNLLKLANTYSLNRTEVLLHYLSSILGSEVWTDDDIIAEISEFKVEIIGYGSKTIETISSSVYPAIDGCNKNRLAYIYGLLSDCYSLLEETKGSLLSSHPNSSDISPLALAHLCKTFQQECQRVSFIKNLNFKNVAGLDGLNFESFCSEIYLHIEESTLEALSKMVQTLMSIYRDSVPEYLMHWQDVYKCYVMRLWTNFETRARTEFPAGNPEKFQEFIIELEKTYDVCRAYIRLLVPSDALDIMKCYFTVVLQLHDSYGTIPDTSTWQEYLIILLNFWLRLSEEMQAILSDESSVGKPRFDPECLSSCLKVFMRLVLEDTVSPGQGWATIIGYFNHGLIGDSSIEIPNFCRTMVFSGCGFGAVSEVFSAAVSACTMSSRPTGGDESLSLPALYKSMLEPVLGDLVGGFHDQNLSHLLSSLSKLEGQMEDLQRVRRTVWETMAQFSNDLKIPSNVRVLALELMQCVSGRNTKGYTTKLESNVLPWEGWDELLTKNGETAANDGLPGHTDTSTRVTSTLVALKSSQLLAAISPGIEITPDDLLNVETAVSCFLKFCESSNVDLHLDVLLAILEEWELLFAGGKDEVDSVESAEAGNYWNNEDWDEGWESFQDVDSLEKEKTQNTQCLHPLHACWMEIFKTLVTQSRFKDVLRLIDLSLSKPNGMVLDEDGARSLTEIILEADCFMALKLVLLLPFKGVQLHCLNAVEDKLKQGGISDTSGEDHEFLTLVLSSGILPTIITKAYGSTFSYLCYLVGNFSRQCQETQLSELKRKGTNERTSTGKNFMFVFRRVLFPCFVSELVKADQHILAGFLVMRFMHTNASLSLVNISEACLGRYLKRQLHALQNGDVVDDTSSSELLKHTVSILTEKLQNLIQSALALLSNTGGR